MLMNILDDILDYDKDTGIFRWKKKTGAKNRVGYIAGHNMYQGYVGITIEGKIYRAHRLAWIMMLGPLEDNQEIDHKNGIRNDNRLSNLRLSDRRDNSKNCAVRSDNKSGYPGVSFQKSTQKWRARIVVDSKEKFLGSFDDKDDAIEARIEAEEKYGFHDGHGRTNKFEYKRKYDD